MKTPNLLLLLTMAFLMWRPAAAQDAREIIKKADDKMQGNSNRSEMKMTIIRPTWQ
ncbi:MAG TPA: outer membrane lipoprotein-sorting protein, partial [Flammeovirgaceae bacterium]|nr:outer membrane lipoprotein-sorting protein [Flammeovirgaceae bacterium]